jgi:hypothetical protein
MTFASIEKSRVFPVLCVLPSVMLVLIAEIVIPRPTCFAFERGGGCRRRSLAYRLAVNI